MKTIPVLLSKSVRRAGTTAALTVAVFSAVLLGGVSLKAATYNWTSANSDGYTNQADWSPNGLPGISDTTIIGNGTQANGSVVYTNLPPDPASTNRLSELEMGSAAGTSTFNMTGGSLFVTNTGTAFILGDASGATNTFTQSGGTLVVARPSTANDYYQDSFIIPGGTGGTGTYTNSGGIADILCGVEIGDANPSTGTFTVNGGTVIDNGWFGVGRGNNSTATFNMMAGAMYILRNPENDGTGNAGGVSFSQGVPATGTANISGGNLYCTHFHFNTSAGSTETLNISGGNLYVGYIGVYWAGAAASQPINISGGTFHTADMLLVAYPGTIGSTSTILSDGTNWSWSANLAVNLTNSTFTVNGMSGPGYVTFAPEATRTITLNNQWSGVGGMDIDGPGSVAMSEVNSNTYTGGTTINSGGTLIYNTAQYTGGTTINSGGTLIYNTAQPGVLISGTTVSVGATLALASAQTNAITGVAALNSGSTLALNNNGALFESPASLPAGVNLLFNETGATTFTNVVTGAGNVVVGGSGTINVGSNLQNTGAIVQTNGAFVVNGTILDASSVTDSGPASVGPFVAQGTITPPIGIGTNSSFETGTTFQPGTLNASNVVLDGTWIAKINTATTVGGGVNDLLICSNLIFNPSSVLSLFPQSAPSVGTYVLAEFVNCPNQVGLFTNATRDAMSLNYVPASGNTLGQLQLIVGSSNPASLVWSATNFQANINWDVNTSPNWTNNATSALDTFHQQDAVAFNAVPGTGVTNRVSVTGQVVPSSITISGGLPYLFSGSGYIGGGTGINYNDTNVSGIYTAGNNYTGPVNINTGVLQLGSGGSSWLGTSNTTTVNGGTLDLNGQNVGAEPLVLTGAGITTGATNGAINNSAATSPGQGSGPLNITLAGNTTLNASGDRWDIGVATLGAGGGSFAGNGYNLIKIGSQPIWMHEVGDIGVGNIDIQQGLLGFEYTIGMGIAGDTVTVEPGATLGFYQLQTNSLLNKEMVLNGNATLSSGGGTGSSNNFIGPITLNGTNTITTSVYPLNLAGNIGGTGGFIVSGTGPLYLGGDDTYSGSTVLGPGGSSLILGASASIPNTPLIYMTPSTNTVLGTAGGVGGGGAITLSLGQTLEGAGSINAANVVAGTGTSISLGTNQAAATYGTIIFTNNLTLNGNTNYLKISDSSQAGVDNDLIQVQNTLTLSGKSTIVVTPTAALVTGNPYTIMEDVNNTISGSVNNLTVISTSPRYTMTPVLGTAPNTGYSALQLNITGVAASLEWKGYLTPNWDLVTSNWYNIGTAVHDHFYNGDNPTFDDTATVTSVALTNNVLVAGLNLSNVLNTYTFTGGGVITGPLNMEGNGNGTGGILVLALSNAPAFTAIDSSAGTLVFNLHGVTNYTIAAEIYDNLGNGNGNVVFGGTNTAILEGNNAYDSFADHPAFYGTFWVTNGVLEYTNVDALGADASVSGSPSFSPLIVTNNGTLNFNGVAVGAADGAGIGGEKWIHISGSGYNGQGALTDSGGNAEPSGPFCNLYLDANVTVGSVTNIRYDQHVLSGNAQQVEGNGFNLTFTGLGAFFLNPQSDGDTHFGNIDVASTVPGRLAFQGGPLALGIPTDYLFVESNALVTFYDVSNQFDTVHAGIDKIMWLKGDAAMDSGGNAGTSNNYVGPVFLTGTNLFGTRIDMHMWNTVMDSNGPGGFVLGNTSVGASGGNLWLEATNTYSGPTIVSNETLYVDTTSSLGLSRYVQVNGGATLNLSATPLYNFGSTLTNQTMSGNGTVVGPTGGNLTFSAGGSLAVGLPPGIGLPITNASTLTISGSVIFNAGSTNYIVANKTSPIAGSVPVGEVSGLTSLTLGGTLVITNYGTSFVAGDSLKLFNATTIATNAYTIVPSIPGPNLAWNISSIPVNGTLSVLSTVTVNPNPTNIVFSVTGTSLTLSWPLDHTGWQLQAQTNSLAVGIGTNWSNVSGSATTNQVVVPINLTKGCVFYRLTY